MQIRQRLTLSAALALAVTSGAGWAASPAAAYSGETLACQGATITGAGSPLQSALENGDGADLLSDWAVGTPLSSLSTVSSAAASGFGLPYTGTGDAPATNCVSFRDDGKAVRYAPIGSATGRQLWATTGNAADRDTTADYISTDEPLTPDEEAGAESAGLNATTQIESFPVAQTAVAVIAHLPEGCQLHALTGFRQAKLAWYDNVMFGAGSKWGHLLGSGALDPTPDPDDTPRGTGSSDPTSCAQQRIERVVRQDAAGASFALKKVLDENYAFSYSLPGRWSAGSTNYLDPAHNTDWPSAVTKPETPGDGAVADYVASHPSSLGYADLATARGAGFDFDNTLSDRKVWLALRSPADDAAQTGHASNTNDPSKDAFSQSYRDHLGTGYNKVRKGAACSLAPPAGGTSDRDYLDLLGASAPASTRDNWSQVSGARPNYRKYEYPICMLTYSLAYSTYSNVPGATEPQARSVFDYTRYLVSTDAQKRLASLDYQGLPDSGAHALRPIASAGLGRINY